ncbi:MAG: hypothetical protein AAGG48_02765 [Planctomycetota bacterium]
MQIPCPGCGKQLLYDENQRGTRFLCGQCNELVDIPAVGGGAHPYPVQSRRQQDAISNQTIIVTALSCLAGLVVLIGISMIIIRVTKKPPAQLIDEPVVELNPNLSRTELQEGYAIDLPNGFSKESREETDRGYTVYRFRSTEGYRLVFAIIPDDSIQRWMAPPKTYSRALIKSIPELSQDALGDVQPRRFTVGGMAANVFQFYEKETFRGVTFIYHMVAMDKGRKLVVRFYGKYGGFSDGDEITEMPDDWLDSLLSLKSIPPKPTVKP